MEKIRWGSFFARGQTSCKAFDLLASGDASDYLFFLKHIRNLVREFCPFSGAEQFSSQQDG